MKAVPPVITLHRLLRWCKEERDKAEQETNRKSIKKFIDKSNLTTAGKLDRLSQTIGRLNALREVIAKIKS